MRERLTRMVELLLAFIAWGFFAFALALLLSRDLYVVGDTTGQVRFHVRDIEFDFVEWTFAALGVKLSHASVDEQAYLDEAARSRVVREYFYLRADLEAVEAMIAERYADPAVADPAAATVELRVQQAELRARTRGKQPVAEAILAEQVSVVIADAGLGTGGHPVPPVAFHFTPLPFALVVSPRDVIRQDANIDVSGDLTLEEQVELENRIAQAQNVSTLIVPLGGIGTYPTMVSQSSDLNWVAAVLAHEWIHNYLTLRPLGVNYLASSELRTMNETTAEMVGNELGALLVERYYPDLARPQPPFTNFLRRDQPPAEAQAPSFDFRAEMHATRVSADRLLAAGNIEAAEDYMEARRRFLWDHGYHIRKLNQAYFAFYGAYALGGAGAAGGDPVGSAVRLLRRRSPSIADFVNTMAWFTSYEDLRNYLGWPADRGN